VPLFDPDNIRSAEVGALWHLVDLLTECEAVRDLAEATGSTPEELKASARERFIIGPHAGPWDADDFTESELEVRFIEFQVYLPTEGGRTVVRSDGSFDRADEAGEIGLITRRLVRKSELASFNEAAGVDGRQDAYLFFADCVSAMEQEAMTKAELRECPRLQGFNRQQGPSFGEKRSESAQGVYLFTHHTISWGDPIEQ
jgi:hypothetical protein